jgi:hypothetical protein
MICCEVKGREEVGEGVSVDVKKIDVKIENDLLDELV